MMMWMRVNDPEVAGSASIINIRSPWLKKIFKDFSHNGSIKNKATVVYWFFLAHYFLYFAQSITIRYHHLCCHS